MGMLKKCNLKNGTNRSHMKNSTFIFLLLSTLSLTALSCSMEKEVGLHPATATEFIAKFDDTKAVLQEVDGQILWQPGDSISVLFGSQHSRFISTAQQNERKSTFCGSIDLSSSTSPSDHIWAVYPYSSETVLDNVSLNLTVKDAQHAVPSSFDPSALITVACCDVGDNVLNFKHLCGGLRFKVADSGIRKITFSGHNDETLAGDVEVCLNAAGEPYVKNVLNPSKSVELECEGGFVPDTWYYVAMLPAALSKGFSVILHRDDNCMTYYSKNSTIVKRAVFGQISNLDKELIFENDWTKNDFVHRSLLLLIPNCDFPSSLLHTYDEDIEISMEDTGGQLEIVQMFANGPEPTPDIARLMLEYYFPLSTPYGTIDYRADFQHRQSVAAVSRETENLFGTNTGIAINSFLEGDSLQIEASLYFKKSGKYRVVCFLAENDATYHGYARGGTQVYSSYHAYRVIRNVVSSIIGDEVSVNENNVVKYRSYFTTIDTSVKKENTVVLVYILRQDRDWFVDNAYSAQIGKRAGLPLLRNVDSSIEPLTDYGNL